MVTKQKKSKAESYMLFLVTTIIVLLGIDTNIFAALPGGTLEPNSVPKFAAPLVKPPVFIRKGKVNMRGMKNAEYYEIAVRQFYQQILPAADALGAPTGLGMTKVWSYGPADATIYDLANRFFYPAFTIEADWKKPVVVKWVNGLVDNSGNYLPHILPVDQTLHWANPPGPRDHYGMDPNLYTGPVPMITHVHGAHTTEESDGYPEAWYLPAANNIPPDYNTTGTFYDYFVNKYGLSWQPGTATFTYANDQRATTLWYHDHTLGMTRVNVYAGPAGFYLIRGGPDDMVLDSRYGTAAVLPGPAPGKPIQPFGTFYEIPIAIQDRSFNADGSLFYPDNRAFFEGLGVPPNEPYLDIPFIPEPGCDSNSSDVAPIWNPEFFGNMMVVNGQTWPFLDVEQRRYRFRLLNGCNSRFLILDFNDIPAVQVWQIGAEGGFLASPVNITADANNRLLMGPAERADVIVDFTNVPQNNYVLKNIGPDEPFGGGEPNVASEPNSAFEPADPLSTGLVMQFRVGPPLTTDTTTPPQFLQLPLIVQLAPTAIRQISLNEESSKNIKVIIDSNDNLIYDCAGDFFGPTAALLGTYNTGIPTSLLWSDNITENPAVGAVETWEIYNFTADAHPIHIHLVQFQVVNRQPLDNLDADGVAIPPAFPTATPRAPELWESGFKDTVIAYPGEVTRVKARFDTEGFFVWHCHIVEHEDNEMMRPYHVGPVPVDAPAQ